MRGVESLTGFKLYVAGGYLRDNEHGVPPKDIDIMVIPLHHDDPWDFSDKLQYIDDFNVSSEFVEQCTYMSDMVKRGVGGLIMGLLGDGTELQFIIYDKFLNQEELTLDMDINICQITCDSNGEVFKSDHYIDGFTNKHIDVLHDYSEKRKKSRVSRMIAKYPDFTHSFTGLL